MKKRALAYIGIVGGLAVLTLGLFTVSQFAKAKLAASKTVLSGAKAEMKTMTDAEPNCLTDESAMYHDRALFYNDIVVEFTKVVDENTAFYTGTAIPAYTLSILTLTSFGLVLKDADKQKELEDSK